MTKKPLTESATTVDAAHHALENARKNLDRKRKLFIDAQIVRQKAQEQFDTAKQTHDQKLVETV